jgi:hypothetical protein
MRQCAWVRVCAALGLVTLSLLAISCGSSSSTHTSVRMVNAIVDENSLDLLIDTKSAATGVAYGDASAYVGISAASHELQVEPSGETNVLIDRTDTFSSGVNATLLTLNFSDNANSVLLSDDNSVPTSGNFKLRIINASPGLGPQDVYVVATGSGIGNIAPTFSSLASGSAAGYLTLPDGNYDIFFTAPGTKGANVSVQNMAFTSTQIRTILALNNPGGGFTTSVLSDLN